MQLVVLGMHRSGTSAVTRLLNMAGAWFGPEGVATAANDENPKGFWERRDVRSICDDTLHAVGAEWWRAVDFDVDAIGEEARTELDARIQRMVLELDAHRPWVVKEPRLCLVLPAWRPLLEVPVCVVVSRDPTEVARSLQTRNGFPLHIGVALWELYTVRSLAASAGLPRFVVRYDDVVADPIGSVDRLLERLSDVGVVGLRRPSDQEIRAFVSPDLHRHRSDSGDRDRWLNQAQAELLRGLDEGWATNDDVSFELSAVGRDVLAAFEAEQALTERAAGLEAAVADRDAEVDRLTVSLRESGQRAETAEQAAERAEQRVAGAEGSAADAQQRADAAEQRAAAAEQAAGESEQRAAAAELAAGESEQRATVAEQATGEARDQATAAAAAADEARQQAAAAEQAAAASEQRAAAAERDAEVARQHATAAEQAAGESEQRAAAAERDAETAWQGASTAEESAFRSLERAAEAEAAANEARLQARTADDARADAERRAEAATQEAVEHARRAEQLESGLAAAADQLDAAKRAADAAVARRDALLDATQSAYDSIRQAEHEIRVIATSKTWKLAWRFAWLRELASGNRVDKGGPMDRAVKGVRRSRDLLRESLDDEPGPAAPAVAPASSRSTPSPQPAGPVVAATAARPAPSAAPVNGRRPSRPKVAVLSWDVGHNPLGRAYIMADLLRRRYDVEIWGAQFERYGSDVWAPMRGASIDVHRFPGRSFPQHLATMEEVAKQIDADAVWVSKARFPSLALGTLVKEAKNRPLVLDVDDHELSFFTGFGPIDPTAIRGRSDDDRDFDFPFAGTWTGACEAVIDAADAVTVSNVALRARFGGTMVPHARDERLFDPARFDRDEVRRQLGFGPEHRLLLFGGTPRVHKGIVDVLEALDRIGDDRYRVLLFGTRELAELKPQIGGLDRWAVALPYQPFEELPGIVAAADLACVLQDPTHPVSRFQMPAKVTDALAMAVPCLVRDVAPLRPLIDDGVVHVHGTGTELHERIAEILADPDDARDRAERGRELFLEQYSYEAVSAVVADVFEGMLDDPPPPSSRLHDLIDAPRRVFGVPTNGNGAVPATAPVAPTAPRRRRRLGGQAPLEPDERYDVVMCWKQNDTGIYGRRQDMFLKYLARSERVGTIVHFDSPVTPEELMKLYRKGRANDADQSRLVVRQTADRLFRRKDGDGVLHRTFLYAGSTSAKLGLPKRAAYPDYVKEVLRSHGIGGRRTVMWLYPTNADLPGLVDAVDPDLVVADVVDDNRTWYEPGSDGYTRIDRNYQDVLARADVVLANCEPVAEAMRRYVPAVHVIPNGCELPAGGRRCPKPGELRGLDGPIIAYVGNLSARLDLALLEEVVRARPGWNFVFAGSAHLDRTILRLADHPNVRFLGVVPYERIQLLLQHVDVALIPHLDDPMTRSMNPLKAFVYCAAGVPVVSTPVANLAEFGDLITIADGPTGFLAAIEAALGRGRQQPALDVLRPHSWDERVGRALALVDEALGGRLDQVPRATTGPTTSS